MEEKDYAIYTIKVNKDIKDRLESLKVHRREPAWEVIKRVLDHYDKKFKQETID